MSTNTAKFTGFLNVSGGGRTSQVLPAETTFSKSGGAQGGASGNAIDSIEQFKLQAVSALRQTIEAIELWQQHTESALTQECLSSIASDLLVIVERCRKTP